MSESRVIHVDIQGQRYAIKSTLDPKYVNDVAAFVDQKMERVGRELSTSDAVRLAVLAALNIADEYQVLKRKYDAISGELSQRTNHLSDALDEVLSEPRRAG